MRIDRDLLRELWTAETRTEAGRVNYRLSLLMFVLIWSLTVFSSGMETVIRIFDPTYSSGTPILQLVAVYVSGNSLCVLLLAILRKYLRKL